MVQLYKKIIAVAFSIFLMGAGMSIALSAETKAKRIRTTTAPFDNILSVTDTNVQAALETLDDGAVPLHLCPRVPG